MLILQINKTSSTFYGNSGQIFCYKKRGVSIFYRNFVARMMAGPGFKKQGRQGEVLTSKSRTDWNWP